VTIRTGNCSGGGTDRFAPTIIVGNVPEGDSAVPYNYGGFRYIPDIGDGAGIAAAVTALSGLGLTGVIHARRGVYDLNQPTSPAVAYSLAGGVSIVGDGQHATIIQGRLEGEQSIFEVFGGGSSIQDLGLSVPVPTGAVSGVNLGVISLLDDAGAPGEILLRNLDIDLLADATTIVTHAIRIENRNRTYIENITAGATGMRLGAVEADWLRFIGIEQVTAHEISLNNCTTTGFDAVAVLGLARLLTLNTVTGSGFTRRYLHQTSALSRATVFGALGIAGDGGAIALDLLSKKATNVEVSTSRFKSFDATEPCVRIQSQADGGHAIIMGSTFDWPHVGGAVMEIGTSGSALACDRNTVAGNHFVNDDGTAGACSVEIFNATSVDNNVSLNSFEITGAGVGLVDGGTTTQAVGNV